MWKYNMWLLISGLLLMVNKSHVAADYERFCNLERTQEGPHPQGLCGDNFNDVLRLVCSFGGFKRSTPIGGIESLTKETFRNKPVELGKFSALSFLGKRSTYGRQGATCECCINKCSHNELRQYCHLL